MLYVFLGQGDGYALLSRAVQTVWGEETLPEIEKTADGKPRFSERPNWHFNLSHSGEFVLCALSDSPVGVDIELVRPRKEGLPEYVLRGEDYERFRRLGGDWSAFYTLWTERESIVKYTGEGLKAWRRAVVPSGCVISHLSGEDWRGAVCAYEKCGAPEYL